MQNIGADNAGDAFYRYKMPKLVAKIEGRGNGIKTNVVNNVEIAKALARPPGYVIKYFGCELGAQTTYVEDLGTSIVNGAHDQKKLSELLEGFIKKYVQCYDCGNPETTIKVSKKDDITLKCKACGAVSNVDPRHKLNTFILKNPPENKLSKEERRLKKVEEERLDGAMQVPDSKDKKEKKKKDKDGKDGKDGKEKKDRKKKKSDEKDDKDKKADASPQDDEDEDEDEEEDDGVVWMTDTSAEAVRKRAEEQLSNATAALVTVVDVEAEEEERRKKEAARKAQQEQEEEEERRKAEEAAAAEALARKAAVVLTLDDIPADRVDAARAIELLRGFPMDDHAMLVKAVRKLNVEGGLAGKMRALYEALLPRAEGHMYLQMKALLPVFEEFAGDPQGQLAQLIALEYLLAEAVPEKLKETAKLLETMYKHDLADGEVIVAWYEKEDAAKILGGSVAGAEAVRAAAKPVYEFLLQEESDEDDDE